jgi:hypothetical protein
VPGGVAGRGIPNLLQGDTVQATQDTIILRHHLESTAIDHMLNHLNARDESDLGRRAASTAQTPVHLGDGGGQVRS